MANRLAECTMDPSNNMSPTLGTPNCGTFTCLPHFVAGIVGLALLEFVLVLYLLQKLLKMTSRPSVKSSVLDSKINIEDGSISLEGNAWVAPLPDVDLSKVIVKQPRKDKRKDKDGQRGEGSRRGGGEAAKDVLEIAPLWRHAFLKDKALFLRAADGTEEKVLLEGCEVLSVSSSLGPSRKWGKKFPIKLHHSDRVLYHRCPNLLFYSESGYAKEAWCEAFRAMAGAGNPLSEWTYKMKRMYREYTRVAEVNMPFLTKFYAVDEARRQKDVKQEEAEVFPKKRMIWRKLVQRTSIGRDHKETKFSTPVNEVQHRADPRSQGHDDKNGKNRDTDFHYEEHHDHVSFAESAVVIDPNHVGDDCSTSLERVPSGENAVSASGGNYVAPVCTQNDNGESRGQVPAAQQKARQPKDERLGKEIEQGVLCLNMIVARLYFDFYHSPRRPASVDRFFQRLIMKIRTPSYIKSINIKELDLGKHPPFATAVRILPSDAGGCLAMELDLEWHGGGHLTCETRLDLREQSTQEKIAAQLTESGSEGDAAAAVLTGIRGDFDVASSASFSAAVQEARQAGLPTGSGAGDEGNRKGRWMQSVKTMMSRVADQVSQVPITLKIRLVSLKGTAVLRLKAPPSDRVWFAFKEMPKIDLVPEPCIGEHRISSGALGAFIAKQIKIQIRESVVMPYCEDFFLNWMVADKDNWLPQSAFPFPFFVSQPSEAERESSKQKSETQSSSGDENGRPRHEPLPRLSSTLNGLNKPPKGGQASHSHPKFALHSGQSKFQKPVHLSYTNDATTAQPGTSAQEHHHKPRRSASSDRIFSRLSFVKPPRSVSSDHLNAQSSVLKPPGSSNSVHLGSMVSAPDQLPGSSAFSLAPQLVSKEYMRPLLKNDGSRKEEALGSAGDSELGTSSMAVDTRSKDYLSHSDDSASESDVQFLANQVANPEEVKELNATSKATRRAMISSLRKKMGNRLDEGRRNVVDKLHHKRPEDLDGSAHSHASGRSAYEAPNHA